MNRIFTSTIVSLLFIIPIFAQQHIDNIEKIAEAERKSAHGLAAFSANPNTENYDVVYHRLDLTADPTVYFISGTVRTDFVAKEEMSTITFDLAFQLIVSAVTQNGTPLTFTQNENNELVIILPSTIAAGTQSTVTVTYSGAPPNTQSAFVISTHNTTDPVLWTLSEPFGAKDWWPCKQDLVDKIESIDVYITAPSQYVSVSNGIEQSQTDNGNGTKTTHFAHSYPIPAYLVAFAISNYAIYTQQAGTAPNEFPIVNYIYPETQEQTEQQLAVTLPIMDFFEERFETYPFHEEKYGHLQCGFGGGMEHTTVSFMGSFDRGLIAHELAHQWFGDKITCGSWQDIWLNESFATYAAALVIEHLDGYDAFREYKANLISNQTEYPDGSVYIADTETLEYDRIFNQRLSYYKGAMVLNMLRFKLGDTQFFQGIKNYLADPELAYSYATTPHFQEHLELASGLDLTEFFNDWIYHEGFPTYAITFENTQPGKVKIKIQQTQSHESVSYFEMPVPLQLNGFLSSQVLDITLDNTANGQVYTVDVPFEVNAIVFDPEKNIIAKVLEEGGEVTSIDDTGLFDNSTAYLSPNPAINRLTATLPDGVITKEAVIYNAIGQRITETHGQSAWDVSSYATGVYFMKLQTSKGNAELKFVKN